MLDTGTAFSTQDMLVLLFLAFKLLFWAVTWIFVLSGLDEFFIDLCYFGRAAYRRLFILPKYPALTEEQLLAKPEQSIAMMIPCWDESAVIRRMLENTLKSVNYANYIIFVGTYPNDPATQREVDLVRQAYGNVERIITPKDGPTSKADCLNWLYKGIQVYEEDNNTRFDIFLMDDSEDIIHPLVLKLCNYVIPKLDMIQLPVHPMPRHWTDFTGNHYIDEFAENHTRDLLVREMLTGAVPSAGVGTAFSRKALLTVSKAQREQLFNINSLTEDYDFGLKIKEFGLRQAFVRQWVLRTKTVTDFWTRKPRRKRVREYISIREFFPNTFSTSVRQKTRWVMGIALQGWSTIGWRGGIASRYMLLRDRKSLVTNMANLIGNVLFLTILCMGTFNLVTPGYRIPPLVDDTLLMHTLVDSCLFFLVWRICMRLLFVVKTYTIFQGLLAVPRLFWANLINFVATQRAIYLYFKSMITGQKASWDKTAHVYPTEDELRAYRRKLGDLLLDKRFLTIGQLDAALEKKHTSDKRLGEILLEMGYIDEEHLVQVLGMQFHVDTHEIDPHDTPLELLHILPFPVALRYNVYPLTMDNGRLVVATNDMPNTETLRALEHEVGVSITIRLSVKSDVSFALNVGYERLSVADRKPLLGERLLHMGAISRETLFEALKVQRRRYRPLREILITRGAILPDAMERSLQTYFDLKQETPLREFWVQGGWITDAQLHAAIDEQRKDCPPLGEVLVELGAITRQQLSAILGKQAD